MRALQQVLCVSVLVMLAGCGVLGERFGLIPQAPANVNDDGARTSRQLEVQAPIANEAPRPRPVESAATPARPLAQNSAAPRAGASAAESYTQVTRYGDLYFISGQIALDPRTGGFDGSARIDRQMQVVMENIRQTLEGQRLTMANVVSVTIYMKSINDFVAMNQVYESFFRSALPARSVVEVSRLPRDAAVEVSVVAGR
jgi:2-iminobutanoate/2-iminopropanoate deaminase